LSDNDKSLRRIDVAIGIFYILMLAPIYFGIRDNLDIADLKNYFANCSAVIAALYGGRGVFMSEKDNEKSDSPQLSFIYSFFFLAVYVLVNISLLFGKKYSDFGDDVFFWATFIIGSAFIFISFQCLLNDGKSAIARAILIPAASALLVIAAVSHFSGRPWLSDLIIQAF